MENEGGEDLWNDKLKTNNDQRTSRPDGRRKVERTSSDTRSVRIWEGTSKFFKKKLVSTASPHESKMFSDMMVESNKNSTYLSIVRMSDRRKLYISTS